MQASAVDTSNFDPEFTNEQPVDSVVDDSHMVSLMSRERERERDIEDH
jgi:serum/glucocorticoid-regulated kinase 2